jgi:hypothetical protein
MHTVAASNLKGTSRATALALLIAFVIGNVGCPIAAPRPFRAVRMAAAPAGANDAGSATSVDGPRGKSPRMARVCRLAPARTQQVGSPAPAGEGPAIVGLILCAHPRVAVARTGVPRSVVAAYLRPAPVPARPDPVRALETPPPRQSAA